MSVRITEDMEEPKDYGAYLFIYPDSPGIYPILIMHDPSHRGKTWIQDLCWETWEVVRRFHVGCAIESLAAHDKRVADVAAQNAALCIALRGGDDAMSIRITEDTPEPSEDGYYFISDNEDGPGTVALRLNGIWEIGDTKGDRFRSWLEVLVQYDGHDIESLAAHDARIRRETLELSDEEMDDVCRLMFNKSSERACRSCLRGALAAVAEHREASDVRA